MAGETALNPGPIHFLCSVCTSPVTCIHCGLQCDNCQLWTYAKCAGASSISVLDAKQIIGLSDHRLQMIDLNIVVQRSPNSFPWARPSVKCSWSSVQDCWSSAPWSVMEMCDDSDGIFHPHYYLLLEQICTTAENVL